MGKTKLRILLCSELQANGSYCVVFSIDIDECATGRHSCSNDTVCFNLDGGYDCRCPHGKNCSGDCIHEDKIKHNGQIWVLENDRCSVCSCQVSKTVLSLSHLNVFFLPFLLLLYNWYNKMNFLIHFHRRGW